MLGPLAPKMVTTLHGTDITIVGQDRSFFEITRFGIERSDAVTAVSEFLKRMTMEEFGITRPIDAIPNFVDPLEYGPTGTKPDRSTYATAEPARPAPRLQLPTRQTRSRRRSHLRARRP